MGLQKYKLEMNAILDSQRFSKAIVISILLLITFLIVGLIKLITGSLIVGFLIFFGLIWYLLKQVGSFVMYPGSFFFSRSDIEMRYSRQIGSRMINCFNAINQLFTCISQKRYSNFQAFIDFNAAIDRHIKSIIATLQMFQQTLSERKVILLRHYREIQRLISDSQEDRPSILDFINRPRAIGTIQQKDQHFYNLKIGQINNIILEIISVLKSFTPPSGTFDRIKFRAYEQSLYQIRFGFSNWKIMYDYQMFHIKTTNDASIESAIIHKRKPYFNQQDHGVNTSKKTILFCNPNGVFIQFFGVDNEYIANYLKLGYHIILWNYRGYGQSTGNPSIARSQQDAYSVYKFYRNQGYQIEIVHGYSIGGPAAVGLLDRISKYEMDPNDKVKILIVDRSFSSIGQMSVQFGKTLNTLARIVLFRDNIDISHGFESAQCKKLLIWDYSDEVIPDKASVKNKIIKRKKQSNKSKYQFDEDQQKGLLNQDQTTLEIQIQSLSKKICDNLAKIIIKHKNSNHSDKELNFITEQHRESSLSTQAVEDNNYEYLIKVMGRVDGGGIDLFHNLNQLQHILAHKNEYFYHICQSYILGLIFYGSYFPLRPIIHSHQKMKEETLNKINSLLKDISERYEIDKDNIDLSYSSTDESIVQIHKNVYYIYYRILQIINQCYGEDWFKVHGSLLPTNNGHNNPLNQLEFRVLNEFIIKSMQKKEGIKNEE